VTVSSTIGRQFFLVPQSGMPPPKRLLFQLLDEAVARAHALSAALAAAAVVIVALLPLLASRTRIVEAALLAGVAHAQLRELNAPAWNISELSVDALFAAAGLSAHTLRLDGGGPGRCEIHHAVLRPARSTALEALVLMTPLLGAPARALYRSSS